MDELKKIVVLDNEILAEIVGAILSDRSIPHLMQTYHDSAMDGLYQSMKGWGHVEAPEKYRQEILAIIDEVKQQGENP